MLSETNQSKKVVYAWFYLQNIFKNSFIGV